MSDKTEIDRNLPEFVIVGPARGDRAKVRSLNRWATYDGENWVIGKGEKAIVLPHGVDPEGVTKQFIANVLNSKAAQDYDPEDVDPEPDPQPEPVVAPVESPVSVPASRPEVVEVDEWDQQPSPDDIFVQREKDALVDLTPRRAPWVSPAAFNKTTPGGTTSGGTTGVRISTETSVLGTDELAFRKWLVSATDDELKAGFQLLNDAIAVQADQRIGQARVR